MKSVDIRIGLILLVCAVVAPFVLDNYVVTQLTLFFVWATVVTQWNLVFGVAGIFSLAQTALFACGAYTAAMLAYHLDWSVWATLPLAGVSAVIFSLLIAVACFRLRGPYVALLTFAITQALYVIIITDVNCFVMDGTICVQLTGGVKGFSRFGDFGFRELLDQNWYVGNYFTALLLLTLAFIFSFLVIRSPMGFAFRALRDNRACALVHGVSRFKYQLLVFAASAFFTGLAGAFYAGHYRVVAPNILYMSLLVYLVAMMVIGGVGRPWGPLAGAAVLMLTDEFLKEFGGIRNIGIGIMIVATVILLPQGVVGWLAAVSSRYRQNRVSEHAVKDP